MSEEYCEYFKVCRTIIKGKLYSTHSRKLLTYVDQSVYQKYGPNLQKIATEMKPFDLTPY